MAKRKRSQGRLQESKKARILARDCHTCRYCGDPATTIDHIVPYAVRIDNSDENLAAACERCNVLADSYVFPSFNAKRAFILAERNRMPVRKRRSRKYPDPRKGNRHA